MKSKFIAILSICLLICSAFSVSMSDVEIISNIEKIKYKTEAHEVSSSAPNQLTSSLPFWTDMVDAENIVNDGSGVYVAVLDTGLLSNWEDLFDHADIAWELGRGFSHDVYFDPAKGFVTGPLRSDRGFETGAASGHGTHVTSSIVGFNYDGQWIRGIAPSATIIPVLVSDGWKINTPFGVFTTFGSTEAMLEAGILYVADLVDDLDGPLIINLSVGGSYSPNIVQAIDYAISKGAIVVTSAGNNGVNGLSFPGSLSQLISVGSAGWTERNNQGWLVDVPEKLNSKDSLGNNWQLYLDPSSSRPSKELGQKHKLLDVTAPGVSIVGPYKTQAQDDFGYFTLSGTSMAASMVTGIAALVAQTHPYLDQTQMEFILNKAASGIPLASDGSLFYTLSGQSYFADWGGGDYGSGFLQADNALKIADAMYKSHTKK